MSKDRLQVFTEWLCREIPMGTVIGNPNWWAPRILSAVDGATREATSQPEATTEMSWEDVEFRHYDDSPWTPCPFAADLKHWGQHEDRKLSYRHTRTKSPMTYEQFLSLVNKAKAEADVAAGRLVDQAEVEAEFLQPTPTEVTQATQVYADAERERLWVEFAKAALIDGDYTAPGAADVADLMLAEFDRRFRKGGE